MNQIRFNNARFGIVIDNQAEGINTISRTYRRSKDLVGVVYEVTIDLRFNEEARAYLINCFENDGGIDAVVLADLYEYDPNDRIFKLKHRGQVNFNQYDKSDEEVAVTIEQTGFERSIVNLINEELDLETILSRGGKALSENPALWLEYHSQTIREESELIPGPASVQTTIDVATFTIPGLSTIAGGVVMYGQLDTTGEGDNDDIEDTFQTPYGHLTMDADLSNGFAAGSDADYEAFLADVKTPRNEIMKFKQGGTLKSVEISLELKHTVTAINPGGDTDVCGLAGALGNVEVIAWLEIRDANDVIQNLYKIGAWDMSGACGTNEKEGTMEVVALTVTPDMIIGKGDKLYVYETVRVYATNYNNTGVGSDTITHNVKVEDGRIGDKPTSYIRVILDTIDEPRMVKTMMLFEAVKRCVEYITGVENSFESTLLGRTDLGYDEDGAAALIGVTLGRNLRESIAVGDATPATSSKIITSLGRLLNFVNSTHCAGLGFELREGRQVVVLETIDHFFDKTTTSIALGSVANLHEIVDPSMYYNSIEFGYTSRLDIRSSGAKYEFNGLRKYSIPLAAAKNVLKIASDVRTSGFEIEFEKRLRTESKDSNLDEELFAISMTGSSPDFTPKTDEGYIAITGIPNSDTIYNLDFSPRRIIENWKQYLAGMLLRSKTQVLTFSNGSGNFEATTQKTGEEDPLAENGDIDVSQEEPIWDCVNLTFDKTEFTSDQATLISDNPYGLLTLKGKDGNLLKGFINPTGIEVNTGEKAATFNLLKAYIRSDG